MSERQTSPVKLAVGTVATALVAAMLLLSPTGPQVRLDWDYDEPTNDVVFEVWATERLGEPFRRLLVTGDKFALVPMTTQQFFICRASNTVTGEVSEWNRK